MRLATSIIVLVLLAFIGASAVQESEEKEMGGWLVSGRKIYFSPLDPSKQKALPGRITTFRPTMRAQGMLVHSDTLWIGTEGGLLAYSFALDTLTEVIGPRIGSITALAADDEGALWIGGRNGLSIRSRAGWRHYTTGVNDFFSNVTDVVMGEDRVWISTCGNGCGFVSEGMVTIYSRADSLLDDRVESFVEEGEGVVWFGTASGLCRSDSLQWKSMRYGHRLPIGPVKDMVLDEEGSLFLAIQGQGVAIYSLGRVRAFEPGRGLPAREVYALSLDPLGKVWAAGKSGLSMFDGSGWLPYRLPGVPIGRYDFLSIQHDSEGNSYLGTDEGLVLVLGRESIKEIALPHDVPSGTVSPLRSHGDEIWLSDGDAVFKYGTDIVRIDPPDEIFEGALTDVHIESDGDYRIASRFGALHFDGSGWEVFDRRQGLPTEHFIRVAGGRGDVIWFGTFDTGVLGYTGRNWIHHTTETGLSDNKIDDLAVDKNGDLWVITATGEVNRLRDGHFEAIALPSDLAKRPSEAASDSLQEMDAFVRFLSAGEIEIDSGSAAGRLVTGLDGPGNVLLADSRGIYRFMGSDWQVIALPEGYGTIRPTSIIGSTRGRIWLGTEDKGVFVRSRTGWSRIESLEGLYDLEIRSLIQDRSGDIWIGTRSGGISRFTPAS